MNVTIQLTPDFPDVCVKKCSLTRVSCAFLPCPQKNQRQSEQLQAIFLVVLSSYI
jgi:hypothetical protein